MTLRSRIESAIAAGPLTGSQIRARVGPIGSIALHRYLGNMRARGYVSARRICGVWTYAPAGYQWPIARTAWDWRMAA